MAIRKKGIAFYPSVALAPSQTGLSDTFTGKYRIEGSTGSWNVFPNLFSEINAGYYQSAVTIDTEGTYDIVISSSNPNISNINTKVVIVAATTDDLAVAIANAQTGITSILGKVDALDADVMASIGAGVTDIDAKLTELKALMSDENDPAIVSLRELLQQIIAANGQTDSVIAALTSYTDDIENMLKGSQYLKDGSDNPFYGKTTHDVYDKLTDIATLLGQTIQAAQTAVTDAIAAAKAELSTTLGNVSTAISTNQGVLNGLLTGDNGLAAIYAKVSDVLTALGDDNTSIASTLSQLATTVDGNQTVLTGKLTALAAQLGTVSTDLTSKLDTIETKIDAVRQAQINGWTATAVM